jgi:hypothetical protein
LSMQRFSDDKGFLLKERDIYQLNTQNAGCLHRNRKHSHSRNNINVTPLSDTSTVSIFSP